MSKIISNFLRTVFVLALLVLSNLQAATVQTAQGAVVKSHTSFLGKTWHVVRFPFVGHKSNRKVARVFAKTVPTTSVVSTEISNLADYQMVITTPQVILPSGSLPVFDNVAPAPPMLVKEPVVKAKKTTSVSKKDQVKGNKVYRVDFHVPQGAVNQLYGNMMPAVYLNGLNKQAEWKHRDRLALHVVMNHKTELSDIEVVMKKRPAKDSILVLNFGKGDVKPVGSDLLSAGAMVEGVIPKMLPKKAYVFEASFPKSQNEALKNVLLLRPNIQQVGMMAILGGLTPMSVVSYGISTTSSFVRAKKAAGKHARAVEVLNSGQQNQIDALQARLDEQNSRLQAIEVVLNATVLKAQK